MKRIESSSNPLARELRQLNHSAAHRRKRCRTVLDGPHLIEMALAHHVPLEQLIVSERALGNEEISRLLERWSGRTSLCSDTLFAQCSALETPLGISAILPWVEPVPSAPDAACLVLEAVQDPGNVGTLLRSAAASGLQQVWMSRECASPWAPRVLRAGMGAHFLLQIHEVADLSEWARNFPGRIVAGCADASRLYDQEELHGATAILIGNEGAGISVALQQHVAARVAIPLAAGVESLNAAVAGSILMFERQRQLRSAKCARLTEPA